MARPHRCRSISYPITPWDAGALHDAGRLRHLLAALDRRLRAGGVAVLRAELRERRVRVRRAHQVLLREALEKLERLGLTRRRLAEGLAEVGLDRRVVRALRVDLAERLHRPFEVRLGRPVVAVRARDVRLLLVDRSVGADHGERKHAKRARLEGVRSGGRRADAREAAEDCLRSREVLPALERLLGAGDLLDRRRALRARVPSGSTCRTRAHRARRAAEETTKAAGTRARARTAAIFMMVLLSDGSGLRKFRHPFGRRVNFDDRGARHRVRPP